MTRRVTGRKHVPTGQPVIPCPYPAPLLRNAGWRLGAKGEERVGSRLEALVSKDGRWRVLHSIEVGLKGADIDHLVVGPGGVYTLNTKTHPRATIWIGGDVLMVNGQRQPYVRNSRHEAMRAARVLSNATCANVHSRGLVVLVGVRDLTVKSPPVERDGGLS